MILYVSFLTVQLYQVSVQDQVCIDMAGNYLGSIVFCDQK